MILIFKSRQCAHWQKMSLKSNGMVSAQLIQRTSHFFENNFHRVKVAMIPSVFAQKKLGKLQKALLLLLQYYIEHPSFQFKGGSASLSSCTLGSFLKLLSGYSAYTDCIMLILPFGMRFVL